MRNVAFAAALIAAPFVAEAQPRACDSVARPLTAEPIEPCAPPARGPAAAAAPSRTHAASHPAMPTLPGWDVMAYCEHQNRVLATESAFMLRACVQQEERAYDILRRDWNTLAAPIRRTCIQQSDVLRLTSYFMLNACVQQELRATQDLQRRR